MKTVSLETARKLKDAGYRQDSSLYWFAFGNGIHEWQLTDRIMDKKSIKGWRDFEKTNKETVMYAAPTTDELLEELSFTVDGDKLRLIRGESRVWHIWYGNHEAAFMNVDLCEGLATMWLYLNDQGLLKGR